MVKFGTIFLCIYFFFNTNAFTQTRNEKYSLSDGPPSKDELYNPRYSLSQIEKACQCGASLVESQVAVLKHGILNSDTISRLKILKKIPKQCQFNDFSLVDLFFFLSPDGKAINCEKYAAIKSTIGANPNLCRAGVQIDYAGFAGYSASSGKEILIDPTVANLFDTSAQGYLEVSKQLVTRVPAAGIGSANIWSGNGAGEMLFKLLPSAPVGLPSLAWVDSDLELKVTGYTSFTFGQNTTGALPFICVGDPVYYPSKILVPLSGQPVVYAECSAFYFGRVYYGASLPQPGWPGCI